MSESKAGDLFPVVEANYRAPDATQVNEVQRQQQVIERLERHQHVTEHLQRELAELRSLVGQMRGGAGRALAAAACMRSRHYLD